MRVKKIRKGQFFGWGAFIQLIGLLMCLTIVGAILGVPLLILGGKMSVGFVCEACGSPTVKIARLCGACGRTFL